MTTATLEMTSPPETWVSEPEMTVHTFLVPDRMAIASMSPSDMKSLFFVSSYDEEDPDSEAPRKHGYQREPMEARLTGIARYFMQDGHRYLITPIIVSVRLSKTDEIEEFVKLFNRGDSDSIHSRWHKAIVSVVDGQHRYLGLIKAHEMDPDFNPVVPVMLYFGLDYPAEATLFDIINSTQRKLPKALIEVTKGDITEVGAVSYDQNIRNIAFALARDEDSVWYDQINMTGARDPERSITYEGLRRSTSNMFTPEVSNRLLKNKFSLERVAKDFWQLIADACPEAWEERPRAQYDPEIGQPIEVPVDYRLKELVGVASIARLGKDILLSSLEAANFHSRMTDLVSLLSEVDWEKRDGNPWMASEAGFAGQKDLYTMLHNLIYLGLKPGEEE